MGFPCQICIPVGVESQARGFFVRAATQKGGEDQSIAGGIQFEDDSICASSPVGWPHSIYDGKRRALSGARYEKLQKTVAILERPSSPAALVDLVNNQSNLVRRLGILALTLDEKVTPLLPSTRRFSGVVVAAIPAEFAALDPGLKAADIIYSLNQSKVGSLEELRVALKRFEIRCPNCFACGTRWDTGIRLFHR